MAISNKNCQRQNVWELQYGNNGEEYKINPCTGEVRMKRTVEVFEGDMVLSLEQRQAQMRYKELEEQRKRRRDLSRPHGDHFFIESHQEFSGLTAPNVARLVFLGTFAGYDNGLRKTQKTILRKADLPEVLNISKSLANNFIKETCPTYITVKDDGQLFINPSFFIKGKLPKGGSFYRVYRKWIRKLYDETPKSRHKHLGYIFEVLPFVNIQFNIICHNPKETDLNLIEPMTLDELCEKIGYNKTNRHRLLKAYNEIQFQIDGRRERFLSIVSNGIIKDSGKSKMFVNPSVLYSGSEPESVKILGQF